MSNQVQIVQGEDVEIIAKFELENGDAFDLTGVTAIEARFKKSDKTVLTKTLADSGVEVVGSLPVNGKIKIKLDDADTNSLMSSEKADFEVTLTSGTIDKIVQFPGALIIKKKLVG